MVTARTRARRILRLYAPVPRIRGDFPYIAAALSQITAGDSGGITPEAGAYSVAVSSSEVSEDMAGYPLFVDLSNAPASFWSEYAADLSDLRAYEADGTTQIPFDIVFLDQPNSVAHIYVKATLSSSTDTKVIFKNNGAGLLGVTDPYGRNATWANYRTVLAGTTTNVDRTGNTATGLATAGVVVDSDGFMDFATSEFIRARSGIGIGGTQTLGGVWESSDTAPTANEAWIFMRYSNFYLWLGVDNSVSPPKLAAKDYNDGYINGGGSVSLTQSTQYHIAGQWDGSTRRDFYVNGAVADSDLTATTFSPSNSGLQDLYASMNWTNALYGSASAGRCRIAYVSNTLFSAGWLAAEAANHEAGSSFYSIAQHGVQGAGVVAATPTVNNSDDVSFSWALTNDAGGRFTIDSSTGVVSLVGTAEAGSFPITIEATGNPSGDVLTLNTTIVIAEGDGNWLPFTLIDGTW